MRRAVILAAVTAALIGMGNGHAGKGTPYDFTEVIVTKWTGPVRITDEGVRCRGEDNNQTWVMQGIVRAGQVYYVPYTDAPLYFCDHHWSGVGPGNQGLGAWMESTGDYRLEFIDPTGAVIPAHVISAGRRTYEQRRCFLQEPYTQTGIAPGVWHIRVVILEDARKTRLEIRAQPSQRLWDTNQCPAQDGW